VNKRSNTVFWAILACLLWSTAYPGIKIGLEYTTPLHFAGVRFILSGLMILPFTIRPRLFFEMVRGNFRIFILVTIFQSIINYTLFYIGMDMVPGAIGAIIVGSQPLFIAIIVVLMKHEASLTRQKKIIITLGIAGIVLVSLGRQGLKLGSTIELLGVFLILGANVSSGISNVYVSKAGNKVNPFVLSSFSLFFGGLFIYLLAIATEGTVMVPIKEGYGPYWISLAWLSFMSAFSFSVWYMLLQRPGVSVTDLNFWKFLIPVFGAILSWLLVPDENPQWLTVAGMVIITFSLIFFYRCNHRNQSC
jgi:drug/metabolite transporter (DMT)-like permease